jgi:SpoVK/Ycf46/Vps4 family AAA+-type ATPase
MVIGATNHGELLDRAVWRRFQIRMNLPLPTQVALTEWLKKFERRINTSLNYSPADLAKKLFGLNFAEAEEFALSVYRQYVLEQPDANMHEIVLQSLKDLETRSVSVKSVDVLQPVLVDF